VGKEWAEKVLKDNPEEGKNRNKKMKSWKKA
jgi:hypothetical protein